MGKKSVKLSRKSKSQRKSSKIPRKSVRPSKKSVKPSKKSVKPSRKSRKSVRPSRKPIINPVSNVFNSSYSSHSSHSSKEWCSGLTFKGVLDQNLSDAEKRSILKDFDDGNYGDVYTKENEKPDLSEWSDFDSSKGHKEFFIPGSSIHQILKQEEARISANRPTPINCKFSSLIYEEIMYQTKAFAEKLCRSFFEKREKVITQKIVMMSMDRLPVQTRLLHPFIPFDRFKTIFQTVVRDYDVNATVEDDAMHLIQVLVENNVRQICKYSMLYSQRNNCYVQSFHVQMAARFLMEKYNFVSLSTNPLLRLENRYSDFKPMIQFVLNHVHDKHTFNDYALEQFNRLINAFAKELIDVTLDLKKYLGKENVVIASSNILPGELKKHAASNVRKAIENNGEKLFDKFPDNLDNFQLLSDNSKLEVRAVIEYIIAEISDLAGQLNPAKSELDTRDIYFAIQKDEELKEWMSRMNLYYVV